MFFKIFKKKKEKIYQSVMVLMNDAFIEIIVYVCYVLGWESVDTERMYLSPDIADRELGSRVREMLSLSRYISKEEDDFIVNNYDEIKKKWKDREKAAMKKYKYKTKYAMFTGLFACDILYETVIDDTNLIIMPMHQEKPGHFCYKSGDKSIKINYNSFTDEELGQAVREGLRRATTQI